MLQRTSFVRDLSQAVCPLDLLRTSSCNRMHFLALLSWDLEIVQTLRNKQPCFIYHFDKTLVQNEQEEIVYQMSLYSYYSITLDTRNDRIELFNFLPQDLLLFSELLEIKALVRYLTDQIKIGINYFKISFLLASCTLVLTSP